MAPILSRAEATVAGPSGPCVGGVFAIVRLPFWFASSELVASLSSLCQVGPGCQLRLPPPPTDRCRFFSSPPTTLHRPTSNLEMPGKVFTHALISPLNFPPLTPHQAAPSSMALRLLPLAVSPSLAPVCPSPATIKGRGAPPSHHHTHPSLNCSLPSSQRPPHRAPPPPIVPHRRPVVSDPPPPPLAADEAHRRPLSLFPQPQ
jgi:hypothetical protein